MKGNITGNTKADKIFGPFTNKVQNAQADYRNNHPHCKYCKYCNVIKPPSWAHWPNEYRCDVSKKNLKRWNRIRARLCKYYEPKL